MANLLSLHHALHNRVRPTEFHEPPDTFCLTVKEAFWLTSVPIVVVLMILVWVCAN